MMYLDLSEIDQVLSLTGLWSRNKRAPARFDRSDYFQLEVPAPPQSTPMVVPDEVLTAQSKSLLSTDIADLDQAVRKAVYQALSFYPMGPIRLLTNLRYFGYCINPISCYYCFTSQGGSEQLQAILIEVTNTPWGQKTHYVLDLRKHATKDKIDFQKAMHVSPFMGMDIDYQWSGKVPGAVLQYTLANIPHDPTASVAENKDKMFVAGVNFNRIQISAKSLNKIILRYPFMTLKVVLGIYWQALRLALKKIVFVPHPGPGIKVQKNDPN